MEETVLPVAPAAPGVDAPAIEQATGDDPAHEADGKEAGEQKPEKTAEQREIERLRRGLARKTESAGKLRERLAQYEGLAQRPIEAHNRREQGDSETVSLSRAEAERLIEQEALRRAPEIAKKQSADEQARKSAVALRKSLGDEFEELTEELSSVFTAPRQLDVLQAENPADLIRYLTNPDNADEAEAIASMSHFQAGRAIARLEEKLKAALAAPRASKAAAPLEPIKGRAPAPAAPSDSDDIQTWVRKERQRLAKSNS